MMYRKEIKSVFVNPDDTIDPIPGVRYFMSECGGSKQPLKEEIIAMIISFLLTGIVPLLMALAVIGWYSVRARGEQESFCLFDSCFVTLFSVALNSL